MLITKCEAKGEAQVCNEGFVGWLADIDCSPWDRKEIPQHEMNILTSIF